MPKEPLPPLTPEQQAEQLAGFNHAFPGFANVKTAVQACSVTANEVLHNTKVLVKQINPE